MQHKAGNGVDNTFRKMIRNKCLAVTSVFFFFKKLYEFWIWCEFKTGVTALRRFTWVKLDLFDYSILLVYITGLVILLKLSNFHIFFFLLL